MSARKVCHLMEPDHSEYDRPEPRDDTMGKAVTYLIGALVVAALLYLIATGKVQIWR